MSKKIVGLQIASLVLAGVLALTGCGGAQQPAAPAPGANAPAGKVSGQITASGSTALLPLVQAAKEQFENANENATVNVSGGGSFTGLTQVANGSAQIGNSDVVATGETAQGLVDHKVAVAPFVIIANKDVTTQNLTMDQLAKILRGEISNWKDVGGKDEKITIVSRPQSSGSRATIVATVLKNQGDIPASALNQDSNGKVMDTVTSTPGAIGYVDAAYYSAAKVNAIAVDGVAYTPDAVKSGKYTIFAFEHMYTKGEPTGVAKAFLDFIMSADFQNNTVTKLGFLPVTGVPAK
ncbi:MAG: phosphate ABC transporter substrate-binding protein [Mycobacterium leprae]